MNVFTVSFFGHRRMDDPIPVERKLEQLVLELLRSKEYVEFLVGRDGEFDLLVASTIRRCKRTYRNDNSALIWVMPYETAEYRDNREAYDDYYDEVEVCAESAGKHFKAAHKIRNRAMIDRSDLAVFCVSHTSGGAYQTLKYAQKNTAKVINLSANLESQPGAN